MFGLEKIDERYQPLAIIGTIVISLSLFLLGLFIFTTFLQPEINSRINQPGQKARYFEGVIAVGINPQISKSEAQNLFSNLGLTSRPPITKEDGTLEYIVEVPRGKELAWISKMKKESKKVKYAKLIEAKPGQAL